MLKQRVITAIVLLAILLPALFSSTSVPFTAVVLILMAAASWEWGRLNGIDRFASLGLSGICLCVCALLWSLGWANRVTPILWQWLGLSWVVITIGLLRAGVGVWTRIPALLRWVAGMLLLIGAWLAVAQARAIGVEFILSIFMLVWTADVSAYFAGRKWGRRKLAPTISPGKSWEGVCGAVVGVFVVAILWIGADKLLGRPVPSIYLTLYTLSPGLLLIGLGFLTTMSVAGDLIESLIKRSAGVKDSSALLPGHGGVLDRIDALLPVLPLAMMLYSWTLFE